MESFTLQIKNENSAFSQKGAVENHYFLIAAKKSLSL